MFCSVYPGRLHEQSEDKATAFFSGLSLAAAEQPEVLLVFTSPVHIHFLQTGQKASRVLAVLIL